MAIQFSSAEDFNKLTSKTVIDLALSENVSVKIKLNEVAANRGISLYKLSKITGIRPATLSMYSEGNPAVINSAHLLALIIALRITDISELIEIQMDSETEEKFDTDRRLWVENGWQPVYKKDSEE